MRTEDFTGTLTTLLIETFESPPKPTSAYLDRGAGLFETLADVSAEAANAPVTAGGTSIAAQVEHTRFFLDVLLQSMDGRTERVDWRESWEVDTVTPESWEAAQASLRTTYERLRRRLDAVEDWGDDAVGDALAMLVHSAYHLGAIRQIVRVVSAVARAAASTTGE